MKFILRLLLAVCWFPTSLFAAVDYSRDYYADLGILREAPKDEIRRAYIKLARQYHPDTSVKTDTEEKFKVVNNAYEILFDDVARENYDRARGLHQPQYGNSESASSSPNRQDPFYATWAMSMSDNDVKTGIEFNVNLVDFSMQDILNRAGEYEKFLAWVATYFVTSFRSTLNPGTRYEYKENPFVQMTDDSVSVNIFLRNRWFQLRNMGGLFQGIIGLSWFSALNSAGDPALVAAAALGYGLVELNNYAGERAKRIHNQQTIKRIQYSLNAFLGTDSSPVKRALVAYDVLEVFSTSVARSDQTWRLLTKIITMGAHFPHALEGMLIRTAFSTNKSRSYREALETDIQARPRFWQKQFDSLSDEAGDLPPDTIAKIAEDLKIKKSIKIGDLISIPSAYVKGRVFRNCERFSKKR